MKNRLIVALIALGMSLSVAAEQDIQALIKQKLKEGGGTPVEEEHIAKDPASGLWSCHGIRLHMDIDLGGWQDMDSGSYYMLLEQPSPIDPTDKNERIKGMNYLYKWMDNPAVIKYFIVDKTGKNLYIRDDVKYFKTYRCKRDE